jgi:hypothetical protein
LSCSSAAMLAALDAACAWTTSPASHRTTQDPRRRPAATLGHAAEPRGLELATAENNAPAKAVDEVVPAIIRPRMQQPSLLKGRRPINGERVRPPG